MEACQEKNKVILSGLVQGECEYSHSLFCEAFYKLWLCVPRLSGAEDRLPVTISERLITQKPKDGDALLVRGQLRSYNMHCDGANRLIITVFARQIEPLCETEAYHNEVYLNGFICKPPVYRTTPFSREITDILLAVNRQYHKSDYLPVIVWGRNARFVSGMNVGDKLIVTGRAQSRAYQKETPDGTMLTRIAYEVSAATLEWGM